MSTTSGEAQVHKSPSKYSSLLRQLSFSMLVLLSGSIYGTFLAFPAVVLTEEGNTGDGIPLAVEDTKWFVSVPLLVCIPGCFVAGTIIETFGIRRTLSCCWLIVAISWTIIAASTAFPALIAARLLQGIAISVYAVVIVLYPAEIGCTKYRGLLVSLSNVMLYFGVMTTYLFALFIKSSYMPIALGIVFLVPHGIGLYISPDSPCWLVRKKRLEDARKALVQLRGDDDPLSVNQELLDIKSAVEEENSISTGIYEQLRLIKNPNIWKPLILCTLLVLMKELTGQFAVTSYTVAMFNMTKIKLDPYVCTAIIGIVRLLGCFVNNGLIQILPRKVLLSSGFILSGISMAIISLPLLVQTDVLPSWLPLLGLVMFALVYSACVNPTAWAVVTELTPTSIKTVGGGIISTLFNTFQFMIGLTFLDLVYLLTAGGAFVLFAVFGLVSGIVVLICIPETSGRSLAQLRYNSEYHSI